MVDSGFVRQEVRVADHFEEVIGLRVSTLEERVEAEVESVKEHLAELQQFVTFSLSRQTKRLEKKMDAHHNAMRLILRDILRRLPKTRT